MKRILLIFWLALNCLPFFLCKPWHESIALASNFGRSPEIVLALCALPLLWLLELTAAIFIFGASKHFWATRQSRTEKILAAFVVLIALSLVTCYYSLQAGAWYFFSLNGAFPEFGSLLTLIYSVDLNHFMDLGSVALRFETANETLLMLSLAGGSFLITLCLFILSPACYSPQSVRHYLVHLLTLFCLAFAICSFGRFSISQSGLNTLSPLLETIIAPQFSFYWSEIAYGSRQDSVQQVSLDLQPIVTPEQWAANIAPAYSKKNLIVLTVEALRADVVNHIEDGVEISPNLNRLAASGLHFTDFYSNSVETGYGQTAILSGQHPLRYPQRDLYLKLDYPHYKIYDLLNAAGYRSAYLTYEWRATKRFTRSDSLQLHFDPQFDPLEKIAPYLSTNLLSELGKGINPTFVYDQMLFEAFRSWSKKDSIPLAGFFFLYSTHFPYDYFPQMGPAALQVAAITSTPHFFSYPAELADNMKRRYFNTVHYVDGLIGSLVKDLQSPAAPETLLVITGDHGEMFHEHGAVTHGGALFSEAIRVPLIIWNNKHPIQVKDSEVAASQIDIAPTLLSLLELPPYNGFQGRNLLAQEYTAPRPVFITNQVTLYEDALIQDGWKLIYGNRSGKTKLFNLREDPEESRDLGRSLPELSAELTNKLEHFRNAQFTYYMGPKGLRLEHFPPRTYTAAQERDVKDDSMLFKYLPASAELGVEMPIAIFCYDFYYFWGAGHGALSNRNIYDQKILAETMWDAGRPKEWSLSWYPYPPWSLFYFIPLGALPYTLAKLIWVIFWLIAILLIVGNMRKPTGLIGLVSQQHISTAKLTIFTLLYPPLLRALHLGQSDIIMLIGLVLYFAYLNKNQNFRAGIALSFVTLKFHLLLPFLAATFIYSLRIEKRGLLFGFISALACKTLCVLFFFPAAISEYLLFWSTHSAALSSLPMSTANLLGKFLDIQISAPIVSILGIALGAIIGAKMQLSSLDQFCLLIPISLIFAPYLWLHSSLIIFPAYLWSIINLSKRFPWLIAFSLGLIFAGFQLLALRSQAECLAPMLPLLVLGASCLAKRAN